MKIYTLINVKIRDLIFHTKFVQNMRSRNSIGQAVDCQVLQPTLPNFSTLNSDLN